MAEIVILERARCFPVLSLQKILQIYISASVLSNNKELIILILKCVFKKALSEQLSVRNGKSYKNVEAKAKELIAEIPLPSQLKKVILESLWPVTIRIIRWKYFHAPTINDNFLRYFYWTTEGKIDSKRTGKSILKNRMIPITKRFMIACHLCLSNEIREIWEDMSIDNNKYFEDDDTTICRVCLFWASKLEGRDALFSRILDSALLHAVDSRLLEAVKHIFNLIPEPEKSDKAVLCLTKLVKRLRHYPYFTEEESDISYYILSQMTETSLKEFFNSYSLVVLSLLLYSPGQKEFLELLKYKLDTISIIDISKLLFVISCKVYLDIFKDYDYIQLFVSVWHLLEDSCKECLKRCFILNFCFCSLISAYFRFIINKEPSKKVKLTSSSERLVRLNRDKWELVHFFIESEIVTAASLKLHRLNKLKWMRVRKSNKFALKRFMKFVRDNKTKKKGKVIEIDNTCNFLLSSNTSVFVYEPT